MVNDRLNMQFCGFGGQGIILAAVIFGTTAVIKAGLNAVQTQSYGSEARGGECQAEVIVARDDVGPPTADTMDLLVAMSQSALEKYQARLRTGGTLVYDPEFVEKPQRTDIKAVEVPASRVAGELGVKLAANMVMLGFLQEMFGLFSLDQLKEVVRDNVPQRFVEVNLRAVEQGAALARESGSSREVPA